MGEGGRIGMERETEIGLLFLRNAGGGLLKIESRKECRKGMSQRNPKAEEMQAVATQKAKGGSQPALTSLPSRCQTFSAHST